MACRRVAILGYHKIGPSPDGWDSWYYVPEPTFADQLRCLQVRGWQVIDLAALLRGLEAPDTLPERAALLTFDDGYRSNLEVAAPVLERFNYPAVIFVPTAFIGGCNQFDADEEPLEAICSWEELRSLERCQVSVQSHGISHRAFSDLTRAEQEEELRRSKAILEDGLGKAVEVFCYPYGDAGRDRRAVRGALAGAGYRAACIYDGGLTVLPGSDPFYLDRLTMGPDTDLAAELEQ